MARARSERSEASLTDRGAEAAEPIIIKKYANRRLYDTETASFVRLDDLHRMVKEGRAFVVRDDKSGRDITSSVLAQIIVEEEIKGHGVLPHDYFRQVLKAYGEGVGPQLASYLQHGMDAFADQQRSFARQMRDMFDGTAAVEQVAEVSRRNLEEFQRAFGAFAPAKRDRGTAGPAASGEDEIAALKRALAEIDERVAKLERLAAISPPSKPGGSSA